MAKIAEVQEVCRDLLKPYKRNAKIHGEEQVKKIADSISEFGFVNPVLIDREYNIIAGHGRVLAAEKLGMDKVPCLFVEGLTEEQRRAYILADNRLAELAEWDEQAVSEELKSLLGTDYDISLTGFDADDIIVDDDGVFEIPNEDLPDFGSSTEHRTERGQLWQLGRHRLLVGDSTNFEDVCLLMNGKEADLLLTDPPYNVAVENSLGDTIANDNMEDSQFVEFLSKAFSNAEKALKCGGAFYIFHGDSEGRNFRNCCENAGLHIRQNLIWVKNAFTLGRQDYQWQHEPCLYGWKEGAGHYFTAERNLPTVIKSKSDIYEMSKEELLSTLERIFDFTTIIEEARPQVSSLHPTMKPQALIRRLMKNSSKPKWIVLDLFGGSGTTLLVAEQLDRTCYMMEYDPKYADVIIALWEEQTDRKAVLLNV